MAGMIANPAFPFDEIRHPPGGPQAGVISQGFRATSQPAFDALHVLGTEAWLPSSPSSPFQSDRTGHRQLLPPAVHGLTMHAHATGDLRFAEALGQQTRRPQSAAFQGEKIAPDSSGGSHSVIVAENTRFVTIFCGTH